jgi:hypothetical protein
MTKVLSAIRGQVFVAVAVAVAELARSFFSRMYAIVAQRLD